MSNDNKDRENAAFFIDANNFNHSLRDQKLRTNGFDYVKLCKKLAKDRNVCYIGYYVGELSADAPDYQDQRAFLNKLRSQGIKVVLGVIERRPIKKSNIQTQINNLFSWCTKNIKNFFEANNGIGLYNIFRAELSKLSPDSHFWVEKGVDVNIAVDIVEMVLDAEKSIDVVYLLSADSDFVSLAKLVTKLNKKIFAVSLGDGLKLSQNVTTFIKLKGEAISDCYLD